MGAKAPEPAFCLNRPGLGPRGPHLAQAQDEAALQLQLRAQHPQECQVRGRHLHL